MSSKASKVKGLLSKGFKADKCKTSIKMSVARMKLMRNKRDVQVKQVRREVAQLLQSGDDSTARIRVDHVIRDEKTISAYELLEVYCELIIQRLHMIDSQKACPIDLKEAIATVVFAAPRCADVPELADVAKQFQAKYGKEFVTSALELRPGSGVSTLVVDKLAASSANIETKMKVLKTIAEENNVKWEAKGFEEEEKKILQPQMARLDGSSKFLKVSETEALRPVPVQTHFPANSQPQNYAPQNIGAHYAATPNNTYQPQNYAPQSGSINKESMHVREEENKTTPKKKSPDPDAEYTTVEEAAEAAAKSAEIASKAAKAAAAMARHNSGNLSREHSNISTKSYSTTDSPRKHEMEEEVSSKPETISVSSQANSPPLHARGPQESPFKPHVAPPAPPSPSPPQSSCSSGSNSEHEVIPEHSKESSFYKRETTSVQKEESYGYSGMNINHSNSSDSKGRSTGFERVSIWDNNYVEEEPEISSSNLRFDSGPSFDDSRLDTYKEEPFFWSERNNSSANKETSAWFPDNFSSTKLPKSGSVHKNSSSNNSSRLISSNSNEWEDPPISPASTSTTKFDKNPKSASGGSIMNDDSSNLLSILSGRNPSPQSHAEEESVPKFDSGPNYDSDVSDENDKVSSVHVHVVEEERVVEEEYDMGSSMSPPSHSNKGAKHTFTPSADESNSKKYPQSLRTRDSRTNRNETLRYESRKDSRAKAERGPLPYTRKDGSSSSDDDDYDSGNQQALNYGLLTGGRRNKTGSVRTAYIGKTLVEEPKPSTQFARETTVDFSVEENRLNTLNSAKGIKSEVGRNEYLRDNNTAFGNRPSERKDAFSLRTSSHVDDEEEEEEVMIMPAKIKLKEPSSSGVSRGYLGINENRLDYQEPPRINRKSSGDRDSLRVKMNDVSIEETRKEQVRTVRYAWEDSDEEEQVIIPPPKEKSKKEALSKPIENWGPFRYVPAQEDSDNEEQLRISPPRERIREKAPGRSTENRRPFRFGPAHEDSDKEEQLIIPPKERIREKAPINPIENQRPGRYVPAQEDSDKEEQLRIPPPRERIREKAPGRSTENQRPFRFGPAQENSEEEEQLRISPPKERTKKEAPSKSSEIWRPGRYVPAQEDSDKEEQVIIPPPKERTKKEASSKLSENRGPLRYKPAQEDSEEEEQLIIPPKERIRKEAPINPIENRGHFRYRPAQEDSDKEEQVIIPPPKERTKKEASSKLSENRGPYRFKPAQEDSDKEEQVIIPPKERIREKAPSKPIESRRPGRYVPAQEDSDKEEQARNALLRERNKKEAPSAPIVSRRPGRYVPAQVDSKEEEQVIIPPPRERIREAAPSNPIENRRPGRSVPAQVDSDKEKQARNAPLRESTEEKEESMNKKEDRATAAAPTFTRLSFPLDMDALRARVQQIQTSMNNP